VQQGETAEDVKQSRGEAARSLKKSESREHTPLRGDKDKSAEGG
jgi:hypothetical protein